jgi:hypothetical protein
MAGCRMAGSVGSGYRWMGRNGGRDNRSVAALIALSLSVCHLAAVPCHGATIFIIDYIRLQDISKGSRGVAATNRSYFRLFDTYRDEHL